MWTQRRNRSAILGELTQQGRVMDDATTLDRTDHEILVLLEENARRTMGDIAERVSLSTSAVKRRIDRMERAGVISGYTVVVDHAKLGRPIQPSPRSVSPGRLTWARSVPPPRASPRSKPSSPPPVTLTRWSGSACRTSSARLGHRTAAAQWSGDRDQDLDRARDVDPPPRHLDVRARRRLSPPVRPHFRRQRQRQRQRQRRRRRPTEAGASPGRMWHAIMGQR